MTGTVCFTIAGERNQCAPKVREHKCDCTSKNAGVLKQADGKLLMCDGQEYKTLQFEVPLGSKSNPGFSCKDILDNGGQTADGVYYITLTGEVSYLRSFFVDVFQVMREREKIS